jgi:hypothetical protein
MRWAFNRALGGGRIDMRTQRPGEPRPRPEPHKGPGAPRSGGPGFRKADDIIDAEFETITPDEAAKEPSKTTPAKKSPWRRRS